MNKRFLNRLPDIKDFEKVICENICQNFSLGDYNSFTLVETGYEDFNFILDSDSGKHFVKIFSKKRKYSQIVRIVELIENLMKWNIAYPKVFKTKDNSYLHTISYNDYKIYLCLFEYIDGKSFYDLKELPTQNEIKFLAKEAAKINSQVVDYELSHVYDSWAIVNFEKEFLKKKKYLNKEEINVLEPILSKFKNVDFDSLPKCFVHGDIISTNVLRDSYGKLWITDFSAANIYPRLIESVIIVTHILFDMSSKNKTLENQNFFLEEYSKYICLTENEMDLFPDFILFSHAMEYLNAIYEIRMNGNDSQENLDHFNLAKLGLEWFS